MITYPSLLHVFRSRARRWCLNSIGLTGLVVVALLETVPSSLLAQTRFHWPSENFAIDVYPTYENCVAVNSRLSFLEYKQTEVLDTGGYRKSIFAGTYSPPAYTAEQLKKCLSRFSPSDIPLNATYVGIQLFLDAQDDSAVNRIVDKRIAAIPAANVAQIAAVIDSVILLYVQARPYRFAAALALYDRLTALGDRVPPRSRILSLFQLVDLAHVTNDDAAYAALYTRYTKVAQSLTPDEWNSDVGGAASLLFKQMLTTGGLNKAVEHLAVSTDAYVKYINDQFEEQLGRPNVSTLVNPQEFQPGQRLPKVQGDYWFPVASAKESYPRAGRVTLVVYVDHHSKFGGTTGTAVTGPAVLRRLANKFPEMDIVLLSYTRGFIGNVEPPPPEKEAALIDSLFRVEYKMPGVHSVSKTPFWKLPDLDGRRIDEESERQQAGYEKDNQMYGTVIDKEGKVVYAAGLAGYAEHWFETIIPVLVKRSFTPAAK